MTEPLDAHNDAGRIVIPHEGDLHSIPLPLIVQSLADGRVTGILTVQGDSDIVAVSFLSGAIVAADALNQTVEEGLGKVLVARGMVDAGAFEALANEHQGGRDGTLADLLVARGLISRGQLLESLRHQTCDQLYGILEWRSGDFKFYGGDEVSYEEGMEPIQVEELLAAAIEHTSGGAVPQVSDIFSRNTGLRAVRLIGQDQPDGDETTLWLTLEEYTLWQQTDGERPASAVMPALRPRRLQVALHRLIGLDLIELLPAPGVRSHQVGATEIFVPPDPSGAAAAQGRGRLSMDPKALLPWAARAMAVLAVIAIITVAVRRPAAAFVPFAWQDGQRSGLENQLRRSRLDSVQRAARMFFLMEKRFPDSLVALVDADLLAAGDLRDPTGLPVSYERSSEDVCRIGVRGREAEGTRQVRIAPDDFLLGDILVADEERTAPLFLID